MAELHELTRQVAALFWNEEVQTQEVSLIPVHPSAVLAASRQVMAHAGRAS
jgi:hypothetical protein